MRVTQLGTDFEDSTPTGTDGQYVIQVPRGTQLLLHTDDFDTGTDDTWFPFINSDHPGTIANEDIDDWLIHACPHVVDPAKGSVPAWDNFLQNWDDANGDRYTPATALESGGIVALVFLGWENGDWASAEGMSVSIDDDACPEGYCNAANFFGKNAIPDPALGPDILYAPGTVETDAAGAFFSFCDAATAGDEVELTLIDNDANRALDWESPFRVPIRPGTITIVLPCFMDGVPDIPVSDFTRDAGLR